MKPQLVLLAALLGGAALAQTTIGNVTITRPGDVQNIAPRTPTPGRTPAPTRTPTAATPAADSAGRATAASVPSDLPNGWRSLEGRVVAPSDVRLPAGSRVQVTIEELGPNLAYRSTYLKVNFAATRLSTPYSLQYSAQRLNPQSVYAVRAKVFSRSGQLLYSTKALHRAPALQAARMNINVSR